MAFMPIVLSRRDRREYFEHYMNAVPCTYSLTLPLAIQVHHAVCDGYHVGLFVEHLRQTIKNNHWR